MCILFVDSLSVFSDIPHVCVYTSQAQQCIFVKVEILGVCNTWRLALRFTGANSHADLTLAKKPED